MSSKHLDLHIFLFALLTLFVIISTQRASAEGTTSTPEYRLIVAAPQEGWPPFIIIDPNDVQQSKGIMFDVMREAARNEGWDIQFATFPEMRSQMMLQEGKIDAYPKAREWVETPGVFRWTDPIITSSDVLVFRNGHFPESGPAKLRDLDVGVVHGYAYPTLDPLFQSGVLKRHSATSTEQLLRMVQRGHIDVAVTNRHVAEWIIRNSKTLNPDALLFTKTPLDSAPYRFAFTKAWDSNPCIDSFNRELEAMKKDGRFDEIINRYK